MGGTYLLLINPIWCEFQLKRVVLNNNDLEEIAGRVGVIIFNGQCGMTQLGV